MQRVGGAARLRVRAHQGVSAGADEPGYDQHHQNGTIQVKAQRRAKNGGADHARWQVEHAREGIGQQDDGGEDAEPVAVGQVAGGLHGPILGAGAAIVKERGKGRTTNDDGRRTASRDEGWGL